MATVDLVSTLKLLRRFGDSEEVVSVIDLTITEIERYREIEKYAAILAYAIKKDRAITDYSNKAAESILKLARVGE